MSFKPFSDKYKFDPDVLIDTFPSYIRKFVVAWIWGVLYTVGVAEADIYRRPTNLESRFISELQIDFREEFPTSWNEFINYIFSNKDRTANFLAYCLQNYADTNQARQLERDLTASGSAYEVQVGKVDAFTLGSNDLIFRVSPLVVTESLSALQSSELLTEAWNKCYARNPDYEKVVSKSCDFLEEFIGKKYFPADPKPQLKKFIHNFQSNPSILGYKGDTIVNPKSNLTSLLVEASNIRGQHTAGMGRKPTKQEAEFVLHTTILIWNLHQK